MVKANNRSLVLFHEAGFGLDEAQRVLSGQALSVTRRNELLQVQWGQGPLLVVKMDRGESVQREAARLGGGTPYADLLNNCDAWFEINFDDLDAVLEETNTLIETQLTLQDATQGILYNIWNRHLSRPAE